MKTTFPQSISLCLAVLIIAAISNTAVIAEKPSIVDQSTSLKLIHKDFQLADGAAWDGAGRLFVPDVKGEKLLTFNLRKPDEPPKARLTGLRISGCCYQLGHVYFSDNGNSRICKLAQTGKPETIAQFEANDKPNDLVVDAWGNIYVTFTRAGIVRRIDQQGRAVVVMKDLVTPNGIALSPDGSTLYVSSARDGLISKAKVNADQQPWPTSKFAQLKETDNGFRGDGMCVDRAGNVYCTGAETLTVFDPSGKPINEIKTPERPINAVIGGADGVTLYISTFGGLYSQRVNAYGVSPNPPPKLLADAVTSTNVTRVEMELNVVYAEIGGRKLLMDVFNPLLIRQQQKPVIIVVHGGGWLKGDKTKFRELAVRLAKRGYVTAAIEYRLGYEAKFPAGIRDCNAATSFLRANAKRWDINPDKIAAVGGSAGGHLVGLMASGWKEKELRHAEAADESPRLSVAVVLAGPLETATGSVADKSKDKSKPSNAVNWLGSTIDSIPETYSLADAVEKIDSDTPPIFFIAGSLDNPQRNQPARDKLKSLGIKTQLVIHPDAKHGHWNRPDWIAKVVSDIDKFIGPNL